MSEDFLPLLDFEEIQQRVLAAAVLGDPNVYLSFLLFVPALMSLTKL